jgi:predicted enzyme related to lactoylglutathione lyase
MDPVVHFQLGARDRDRMIAFYTSVFGWETQTLGDDMGGYTVVTTTETVDRMPQVPGEINGGFYMKTDDPASDSPSIVISVADIAASSEAIRRAGGQVSEPDQIPGVGSFASFHDPEGNRVGMLQPLPR